MTTWLVPVTTDKRRVVRVEAENEWAAQSAASALTEPVTDKMIIDHAIPQGSAVCGWGCCTLRPSRS